jgi:hypothetical protein
MVMDNRQEQISALLDGELDEFSTHRLLTEFEDNPEWEAAWTEYALIGDVLRHGVAESDAGVAGAKRAMEALQRPVDAPKQVSRWVALALAASLAAVAVWVNRGAVEPSSPAVVASAPAAEMDRYMDMHQEVSNPGVQKVSLASIGTDGGR